MKTVLLLMILFYGVLPAELNDELVKGAELFKKANYEEAAEEFQSIINLMEQDVHIDQFKAYPYLAKCYYFMDEEEKGEEVLENALIFLAKHKMMLDKKYDYTDIYKQLEFAKENYPEYRMIYDDKEKEGEDLDPVSIIMIAKFDMDELSENLVYPEKARRENIQGRVLLKILINEEGEVLKILVVESDNPILNKSAIDAVKYCEFEPAYNYKGNFMGWSTLPINFNLK